MIRKAALSLVLGIAAFAQPALAATFNFSTTTNPAVKDPGAFSATFDADGNGGLLAASGLYNGTAVSFTQFNGTYDATAQTISTLTLKFSYNGAVYTMTALDDQTVATYSKVGTATSKGGTSLYSATPSGFASVPEIDGSKLPLSLFIIGSFMLWMQNRRRLVAGGEASLTPVAA